MERISVVQHQGQTVLVQDFTGLREGDDYRRALSEAKAYIGRQPPASVRSVFDATGAVYNAAVIAELKDFTAFNKPFMKASAVVGVEGILGIALLAVEKFSGRTFKRFKDRAAALDWVVAQP